LEFLTSYFHRINKIIRIYCTLKAQLMTFYIKRFSSIQVYPY